MTHHCQLSLRNFHPLAQVGELCRHLLGASTVCSVAPTQLRQLLPAAANLSLQRSVALLQLRVLSGDVVELRDPDTEEATMSASL